MAMRVVSEDEYSELYKSILLAKRSPNYHEVMESILENLEKNLTLIGCTATQDCIEELVVQQIQDFKKAGKMPGFVPIYF